MYVCIFCTDVADALYRLTLDVHTTDCDSEAELLVQTTHTHSHAPLIGTDFCFFFLLLRLPVNEEYTGSNLARDNSIFIFLLNLHHSTARINLMFLFFSSQMTKILKYRPFNRRKCCYLLCPSHYDEFIPIQDAFLRRNTHVHSLL